jgi:hypothetical protein
MLEALFLSYGVTKLPNYSLNGREYDGLGRSLQIYKKQENIT